MKQRRSRIRNKLPLLFHKINLSKEDIKKRNNSGIIDITPYFLSFLFFFSFFFFPFFRRCLKDGSVKEGRKNEKPQKGGGRGIRGGGGKKRMKRELSSTKDGKGASIGSRFGSTRRN